MGGSFNRKGQKDWRNNALTLLAGWACFFFTKKYCEMSIWWSEFGKLKAFHHRNLTIDTKSCHDFKRIYLFEGPSFWISSRYFSGVKQPAAEKSDQKMDFQRSERSNVQTTQGLQPPSNCVETHRSNSQQFQYHSPGKILGLVVTGNEYSNVYGSLLPQMSELSIRVGGFNPFEKYAQVKMASFSPKFGVKKHVFETMTQNMWARKKPSKNHMPWKSCLICLNQILFVKGL